MIVERVGRPVIVISPIYACGTEAMEPTDSIKCHYVSVIIVTLVGSYVYADYVVGIGVVIIVVVSDVTDQDYSSSTWFVVVFWVVRDSGKDILSLGI